MIIYENSNVLLGYDFRILTKSTKYELLIFVLYTFSYNSSNINREHNEIYVVFIILSPFIMAIVYYVI